MILFMSKENLFLITKLKALMIHAKYVLLRESKDLLNLIVGIKYV